MDSADVAIGLEFLDVQSYVSSVITVSSGDSRLELNEVTCSEMDESGVSHQGLLTSKE